MLPLAPGQRWLEVACGTGIVSRALAPHVREVVGCDITEAMLRVARREGAALANLRYLEGDATALPFLDGEFDGAITRFSLHHIPFPERVLGEMVRVVRPGGAVAVGDHLGSTRLDAFNRHQSIERLRDPSHWANLTAPGLQRAARSAGLRLVAREESELSMSFDEWLTRGSGGLANAELIESALAKLEDDPYCALLPGRVLRFRMGRFVWRKPLNRRS